MTAPTPTPPAGPPTPGTPAPTPPAPPAPAETFTQEDVNRIVAERITREKAKYVGFDDLKDKAAKFDALQAENATELEKAVAQAVETTRADAAKAMNNTLVRAEVKASAAAAQFHDPADAAALLAEKFSQVPVDSSGEVDVTAAKALVDQLATDKPHLVKTAGSGPPAPLPGQGTPPAAPKTGSVTAGADEYRRRKQANTT